MAELQAFTIQGVINLLTGQAEKQLDQLGKAAKGTGSTIDSAFGQAGNQVLKFAGPAILGALAAGLTIATTEAVKMGIEIHDAMVTFQAQTEASVEEAGRFGDMLEDLHTQGVNTFEDIASTLTAMRQTLGPATADTEQLALSMLEFAHVTGGEGADAVKTIRSAVQGFGADMGSAAHYADMLAAAQRESGANGLELGKQLGQNAFLFKQFGIDAEHAIGMLALFNKNNVDGGVLVRGFARVMEESNTVTTENAAKMYALGVAFDSAGKPIGGAGAVMQAIIKTLQDTKAPANLVADAFDLLGRRAGPEFARGLEGGQAALDKMTAAVHNSDGASHQMADTLKGTVKESWELFKRSMDPALETLGKLFTTIVIGALKGMTDIVNGLKDFGKQLADKATEFEGYWNRIFGRGNTAAPTSSGLTADGQMKTPEGDLPEGKSYDYQQLQMRVAKVREGVKNTQLLQAANPGAQVVASGGTSSTTQGYLGLGGANTENEGISYGPSIAKPLQAPVTQDQLNSINYGPNTAVIPAGIRGSAASAPAAPAAPKSILDQAVDRKDTTGIEAELTKQLDLVDQRLKLNKISKQDAADEIALIQKKAQGDLADAAIRAKEPGVQEYLNALEQKAYEAHLAANEAKVKSDEQWFAKASAQRQAGATDEVAMLQNELRERLFTKDQEGEAEVKLAELQRKIADANEDAVKRLHALTETTQQQQQEALQLELRDMKEKGVAQATIDAYAVAQTQKINDDKEKADNDLQEKILANDGETRQARLLSIQQQVKDYENATHDKLGAERLLASEMQKLADEDLKRSNELAAAKMKLLHQETAAAQAELQQRLDDMKRQGATEEQMAQAKANGLLEIQQKQTEAEASAKNEIYSLTGQKNREAIAEFQVQLDKMGDSVSLETKQALIEAKRLAILKEITGEDTKQSAFAGGGQTIQEAFKDSGNGLGKGGIFDTANPANADITADQANAAFDQMKQGVQAGPNADIQGLKDMSDSAQAAAGGGDSAQWIYTAGKLAKNPNYQPGLDQIGAIGASAGASLGSAFGGSASGNVNPSTATEQPPVNLKGSMDINIKVSGDPKADVNVNGQLGSIAIQARRIDASSP